MLCSRSGPRPSCCAASVSAQQPAAPAVDVAKVTTEVKATVNKYYRLFTEQNMKALPRGDLHDAVDRRRRQRPRGRPHQGAGAGALRGFAQTAGAERLGKISLTTENVCVLNANAALASGYNTRYKKDGSVMSVGGVTYLLGKTKEGWRIVSYTGHAKEKVVRCNLEGVLVSVKRAGSTVTTTVVTDREGRYGFRARGSSRATTPCASEPSDTTSSPGPATAQDGRDCRPEARSPRTSRRSSPTPSGWRAFRAPTRRPRCAAARTATRCRTGDAVASRRAGVRHRSSSACRAIRPLAFPLMPQRTPAPRVGGGEVAAQRQSELESRQAEYLSTLNLSVRPAVELRVQDAAASDRRRHARHLHRIRPAAAHAAAPRRRRRLGRAWPGTRASASRSSASSIRRPARSPSTRSRC